ncbi:MAG: MOSC domain-containing protein [Actinomycetota bacterium]|nr:MOSC domain-containing protein [Actinomycetota bacterium]
MPVALSLHVAPTRHAPMVEVDSVEAEAGAGLVGDRYHGTRHRHVTVQSRAELDEAARALGAPIPSGRTRRNVTLDGGAVPTEPGARIVIGGVELEVVRKAAPCRVMDREIGDGARRAMHGRGGAVCRVRTSGTIAVGDAATITHLASRG